jgi:chaperonin GroEL (HSP60 family)
MLLSVQSIIRSYRQACALAVSKVKELSVSLEGKGEEEKRGLLVKCAATSLNSKLVRIERTVGVEASSTAQHSSGGAGTSSRRAGSSSSRQTRQHMQQQA